MYYCPRCPCQVVYRLDTLGYCRDCQFKAPLTDFIEVADQPVDREAINQIYKYFFGKTKIETAAAILTVAYVLCLPSLPPIDGKHITTDSQQ